VPDAITVTGVNPQTVSAGADLVVHGSGFLNAEDVTVDCGPAADAAWPVVELVPAVPGGTPRTVRWPEPRTLHGSDTSLTVPIAKDTPEGDYHLIITRDGLSSAATATPPTVHVAIPVGNVGDVPMQRSDPDPALSDPLPDKARSVDAETT
jgi:hypothetical protein